MTYDEFKQNFLPEFLNINSYAGRMRYAKENLQRIGSGTGRVVYDIDGEKVLKLAKNAKGVAQNGAEGGAGYYRDTQHIVTEIFDGADDDTWIISEKAKKVNERRIKELTEIPSLNDLFYFLRNFKEQNNGKGKIFSQDKEMEEFFWENEFAQDLQNFIANYNQSAGDMGRPSTYGEVLRDGQPTIVLTDYGLNDEVYDTHYSPERNKSRYQMYELFNYADGNDDILSDTGGGAGGNEIRTGMWAQMPYSVSDGQGVINEKFINFVSNHDKYPDEAVAGLPVLTDSFHECVNNIKETLKLVENKERFYGNLLKLQEYLIRRGFYNRDSLLSEEYFINEDTPAVEHDTLKDRNYSDELAKAVAIKLNLTAPQYLGSGGNGIAYEINDNLVMKLTTDISEADAASKLMRGQSKNIATIFNLYKVHDTETEKAVFAIMQENINDKPLEKFRKFEEDINRIAPDGLGYDDIMLSIKKPKRYNHQDWVEWAKKILTENPNAGISESDRKAAYEYLVTMFNMRQELLDFGIKSTDYIAIANLGYKNGVLKFFDTGGYYGVSEPDIKDDNIISLPETVDQEQLTEDYPRDRADAIALEIGKKLGVEPHYLNHGTMGVAYDIGDEKILKITKDNSEAAENMSLIGKPLKYIAEPYRVFQVNSEANPDFPKTYGIILEKLKTDPPYFRRMYDRLEYVFKNIFNIDYKEALEAYQYGHQFDNDINKDEIDHYFKKNPEDAEFFFSILRIAEEVDKYGVESLDYYNVENLGYKKSGAIGFFDVGFGNGFLQPTDAEQMNVAEDGSAKFSTDDAMGQDGFPTYDNTADSSPSINNDLDANIAMYEDLEYNHVVGDATQDKFELTERDKSFGTGSKTVKVKRKCQLAGLGNTSVACNQGDINNLEFGSVNENDLEVTEYFSSLVPDMNEGEYSNMGKLNKFVSTLKRKPFIRSIINDLSGEVFAIGGVVRDLILNKPNKDIDLVIREIPIDTLIQHLQKFGKVDAVGKSFGVLKFIDGDGLDYDIALPRTDKKNDMGGYRGFDVQSDENLSIEADLERRDAKMNAMAINLNTGKFIDPLGGLDDIENKQISAANPEAFSDDPLRMLRIIQFASRFGFTIEPTTMQMITDNAGKITEIAPERILIELDKIVTKGNPIIGVSLLASTGLFKQIFGNEISGKQISRINFNGIRTMGEFLFLMMDGVVQNPAEFYLSRFSTEDAKRDRTYKELQALDLAFNSDLLDQQMTPVKARSVVHNMFTTAPQTLESQVIPEAIKNAAQEFLQGKYPKTVNELAVNGNDLMNAGLQGKAIGDMQKSMLIKIYADKIRNDREELLSLINDKNTEVQEGYFNYSDMQPKTWDVNGEQVTIDFFVKEYDKWNTQGESPGYANASRESVLEFLQNNYEDFSVDEKLNKELYWALIDRDLLKEDIDRTEKVEYGALMLYLDVPVWKKIISVIKKEDVYEKNGEFGIETEPHVTILYGFHDKVNADKVFDLYKKNFELKPIEISVEGISMFENEEFDVVKMDVDSKILSKMNSVMRELPNTTDFPKYNPHITLAYVKKGTGEKYVKSFEKNHILVGNEIVFSTKKEKKKRLKLTEKGILKEEVKKASYSAVVLDKKSRTSLLKVFQPMIPEGWEVICHHMTINMGEIDEKYKDLLGTDAKLDVTSYAMDELVMAVGVKGVPTNNAIPHVTLAVNRADGGKPYLSNKLKDWKPINFPIELTGKVSEV